MGRTYLRMLLPARTCLWPLGFAVAFMMIAWGVHQAGLRHAETLDVSLFGRCEDVCDALSRDGYVATQVLPFHRGAALLGFGSIAAFIVAMRLGSVRVGGAVVGLVCITSTIFFGLAWLVCSVFASDR